MHPTINAALQQWAMKSSRNITFIHNHSTHHGDDSSNDYQLSGKLKQQPKVSIVASHLTIAFHVLTYYEILL